MNNTKKSNGITRLTFLKNSGFLAAGITLLPGFVLSQQRLLFSCWVSQGRCVLRSDTPGSKFNYTFLPWCGAFIRLLILWKWKRCILILAKRNSTWRNVLSPAQRLVERLLWFYQIFFMFFFLFINMLFYNYSHILFVHWQLRLLAIAFYF